MPVFSEDRAQWLTKALYFKREAAVPARNDAEKDQTSFWKRHPVSGRATARVAGLPETIPGELVYGNFGRFQVRFAWKSILPVPSSGVRLHATDERGISLLCENKECPHGAGVGAVARR